MKVTFTGPVRVQVQCTGCGVYTWIEGDLEARFRVGEDGMTECHLADQTFAFHMVCKRCRTGLKAVR